MGAEPETASSLKLGFFSSRFFKIRSSFERNRMRVFLLSLAVVAIVVDARALRHRIADELPSRSELASAYEQMKDMKLKDLAQVLRNSAAVKSSVRRAAMDMQEHTGLKKMAYRLSLNPEVHQAVSSFMEEGEKLTVSDLTKLRQSTSPSFQSSVRAAIDSMMADEGSRPLATHLKQAWDAESVDEQLKHLNMALDVLDTSEEHEQSDDAPAQAADDEAADDNKAADDAADDAEDADDDVLDSEDAEADDDDDFEEEDEDEDENVLEGEDDDEDEDLEEFAADEEEDEN